VVLITAAGLQGEKPLGPHVFTSAVSNITPSFIELSLLKYELVDILFEFREMAAL
jgi:hypothetical protein